jgi:di/tricarboxylate transporter
MPIPVTVLAFAQNTQQIIASVILLLVLISFIRGRLAPEVTALTGMMAMVLTGILPVKDATGAFADRSIIMIAGMLVICTALERTGIIARLGLLYEKASGNSAARSLWLIMLVPGLISAFCNNTSLVVIFMPIVMAVCRRQGTPPSRLLIPLSFATVAGGMISLVGTSTNMNVVTKAAEKGYHFGLFDVAPLGIAVMALTLIYLGLFAKKLLPDRVALSSMIDETTAREYLTRAFVAADSPMVGRLFTDTPLSRVRGIRLIEVIREGAIVQANWKELVLQGGDQLILKGKLEDVMSVRQTQGIEMVPQDTLGLEGVKTEKAVIMEAVLGPGSALLHKSIKQLNFRQRYGVIILAVHRMGVNLRERFEDMRFMMGDALLLEGPPEQMNQLFKERGFINLTKPKDTRPRTEKAWLSVAILALVMVLGALSELPWEGAESVFHALTGLDFGFEALALAGAVLCVLLKCLDASEVYETMEWRLLFMIAGTIAIGRGMEACGLSQVIGQQLSGSLGGNPWIAIGAVYLLSVVLTEFLSNNTVAILLTPIAITTAHALGYSAEPFIIAVMFGATLAFSTPIGYQTNLLVYNAGGYKFGDFARIGIPLTILLWILCSLLIPLIWPLTPLP